MLKNTHRKLAICAFMVLAAQANATDLSGSGQPQLVLSDSAGLPFYPAETHVFADRGLEIKTFSLAEPEIATASAPAIAPGFAAEQKAPAAVALRATVLRRSQTLVRRQTAQPVASRNMMPTDIMDSWSVGVFR